MRCSEINASQIAVLHLGNLTIDNAIIHKKVSEAVSKVQQGTHLSTALRSVDIMPSMVLFMIATGEQTGKLEFAKVLQEEIDKKGNRARVIAVNRYMSLNL